MFFTAIHSTKQMGQSMNKSTDSKLFILYCQHQPLLQSDAAVALTCGRSGKDVSPFRWRNHFSKKHIPDHSKQKTELSKFQSTDLNAIQNLISDWVSFSILLARTGVLRAHHSYLVPSSIAIPYVGWISAAFIKFSSVIASRNSSIESKKYRRLSEPTL